NARNWLAGLGIPGLSRAVLFPENDSELVPANAGHMVVIPAAGTDKLRRLLEDLIPYGMAVAVVVALEIVDVEEQEGDGEILVEGAFEDLLEKHAEVSAVVETGQVVADRQPLKVVVPFLNRQ